MFTDGQRIAVENVFALAGYSGTFNVLPGEPTNRLAFVLDQDDLLRLPDVVVVEQVLGQVLGLDVWLLASIEDSTVPF